MILSRMFRAGLLEEAMLEQRLEAGKSDHAGP